MQIQHDHSNGGGSFFISEGEKIMAEMVYIMGTAGEMIIQHTEVNDALKGQNVGTKLVDKGVEYAIANNLKIVPVCRFANSVIQRNPSYKHVVQ